MPTCRTCNIPLDPRKRLTVCTAHGWEASPGPQTSFLASGCYEKLYGGAAGGGKTDALVMGALANIHIPQYKAIIFRRTLVELEGQVIPKSEEWYPRLGGKYNKTKHVWVFPSGAKIHFGHIENDGDETIYQGWEFQYVGFDELTSFSEKQYRYLLSRIRSAQGIHATVASATNPGGEGHEWVVNRWAPFLRAGDPDYHGILAAPSETMFYVSRDDKRDWVTREEASEINALWDAAAPLERVNMPRAMTTTFIPAKLEDNPHLLDNDPEYAARLNDLDRHTFEQLRKGNWLSKPNKRDFFQKEWFDVIDALPPGRIIWARWWDRAATEKKEGNDPDFTASVKLGRCEDGTFIVDHAEEFRAAPPEVAAKIEWHAKNDGKGVLVRGAQDPGSAGVFEAASYVRLLSGFDVEFIKETGDKADRARPVSSQAKARNIKVMRGSWNRYFFDRIESFPFGHDDTVDAFSGAFMVLNGEDVYNRMRFKGAMAAIRAGR